MKTRLLKRLRREGRNIIHIHSVTITANWSGKVVTGMSYGYSSDLYKGLFCYGDTEEDVIKKAMKIYVENEVKRLREKKNRKKTK